MLYRLKGTPNNVGNLQRIVGRIQPIRLSRPCVMCVPGPKNFEDLCNASNIVVLRFGDQGTKEMLVVVGLKVWPVLNFA